MKMEKILSLETSVFLTGRFYSMTTQELRDKEVYYIELLKLVHEKEAAIKKELAKIRGKYT